MTPSVAISRRGEDRLRSGHPWIYRSDVADAGASGGDLVRVTGVRGRTLGYAFYSDRSEIALRLVSHDAEPPAPSIWRERIADAAAYRDLLQIDATAYRLVHGESDGLPGLVVDRYDDVVVLQALTQGMDRLLPDVCDALDAAVRPRGILARNDPRVRELEGLERRVEVLRGEVPPALEVHEGRVRYVVDPYRGQKTGLFLDQRENRFAALQYARGRLLDAFSYQGGFALTLAPACREVLAVDSSEDAASRIRENAARNGVIGIDVRAANVFDELRELERRSERFDTIVLDPPAFAKNRASVPKALSGYKEINLRALKLLPPGGFLITCSCSYHVSESAFADMLAAAAVDARVEVVVAEKRMQSRDHPVLLTVPETLYLKCFVVRRVR